MIIIACNLFFTFVVANPCVPDPCQNSGVCTYTVRFYSILVTSCHQHHLHFDLNIRTLRRRTIHVYALLRHLVTIVRSQVDFKYFHYISCKNEAFDEFKNKVKVYVREKNNVWNHFIGCDTPAKRVCENDGTWPG